MLEASTTSAPKPGRSLRKTFRSQALTCDMEMERDPVAADLQLVAYEEMMRHSPSPDRDVALCEDHPQPGWQRTSPAFGPLPDGSFRSTVDSWNRQRDRTWVEQNLRLPERGNDTTIFAHEFDISVIIGVGYRRILYGDHGPYIEFTSAQICWESFPVVRHSKPLHAYYDVRFSKDQHVMAYEQRKTVRSKPNPPPGRWSVNNNRHETGYADYQPGYIYVSVDCVQVLPSPAPTKRAKLDSL
mmetsp:Transcript_15704/g.37078  ORF Transcript_15704/g.37078 Transcript_15704/m.37078 type:complete len:242 (-) Transcript_15704:74-799(-)